MHIFDYNRVLKDLNSKNLDDILKELSTVFTVRKMEQSENPKPNKKGNFSFYADKNWYELVIKKELTNDHPVKGLDVELLTSLVIDPVFGNYLMILFDFI